MFGDFEFFLCEERRVGLLVCLVILRKERIPRVAGKLGTADVVAVDVGGDVEITVVLWGLVVG